MSTPHRHIFIFLDGVGLNPLPKANPFAASDCRYLPFHQSSPRLPDGTPVTAVDAVMGIEGLPQSASGQAMLYTGVNVPSLWGHRGSYPGVEIRQLLFKDNLLKSLRSCGRNAVFLNAYPHYARFFQSPHLELTADGCFRFSPDFPHRFRRRLSTTTCMMLSSGLAPRDEDDIRRGTALYQDFSNNSLIRLGLDVPAFSPEKAAEIIASAAQGVDLLLYEFFQTDLYAHRKAFKECVDLTANLDRLVGHLLSRLDPDQDTLLLTSDHGNLEDCSQRTHTRNPVPLLAWGRHGAFLRERIHSLADVTPALRSLMACPAGHADGQRVQHGYGDPHQKEAS